MEYQKAMSLGAFLAWSNDYPVNAFAKPKKKVDAKGVADSWGITDTNTAHEAIEWLLTGGHRAHWEKTLDAYRGTSNEEDSRAAAFAKNLEDALPRIMHYQLIGSEAELFAKKIDAWDYGRIVFLASESLYLGYLTEAEAMDYALKALQEASQTYSTWTEYARSYLLGRLMWGGARSDTYDFVMVMMAMLQYEDSPWNRYPLDPFYKRQYEQEKQQLLAKSISPFKVERAVEINDSKVNSALGHRSQTDGSPAIRTGWLHRMVGIPILGRYIGLLIAVVVPLLVMFLVMPVIHATLGEGVTQGRRGRNVFGAIFFSLTFAWTYLIAAKKNLRLTTPLVPIPLTWISGFFAVVAMAAIFL